MSAYQSVTVNGQPTEPVDNDAFARMAEQLRELRQQNQTLTTERNTAQAAASKAQHTALVAEHTGVVGQQTAFQNYIAAKQTEIASLTAQKKQLFGEGRFDELSDVDAKIIDATVELRGAERDLGQLSGRAAEIEARAKQPAQPTQADRYANMHPNVVDWIKRNPLFETNQSFNAAATAGDAIARHNGATPGSDRYIEIVEEEIERITGRSANHWHDRADPEQFEESRVSSRQSNRQRFEDDAPLTGTARNPQRAAAGKGSMAAMPSRQVAGNPRASGNRLPQLTAEQRDYALTAVEFDGYDNPADRIQAYQNNLARARQDGRFDA
jgi:hypothetical protein